ncbi:P-loop NTPase family protein [Bacillus pumilus]|uniref:ATP-binding cassette domain-containing protein n=1 Tax=Bacillus pumilus TaxID=1408 RepID=UPI0011A54E3A|nr:ATP-binding cassette domain-containing protein [Bacillus pumilus]
MRLELEEKRYSRRLCVGDIEMKVEKGGRMVVLGENGGGKRRMMEGMFGVRGFTGWVWLDGEEVKVESGGDIWVLKKDVCYIGEDDGVLDYLRGRE